MWRIIAFMALLTGLGAGHVCADPARIPSQTASSQGQPYRIDSGNRFMTAVMINGQGPFSFVIDTASSKSMIQGRVHAQLGLTRSQPNDITVYSLNSTATALPVKASILSVAGQDIHGLTLGVLPPGRADTPGVDGILGIDVLSRYFVVLDRGAMRLMLLAPGSPAAEEYRGWASVPLTPRPLKNIPVTFWYMTARVSNRADGRGGVMRPGPASMTDDPYTAAPFTALLDLGAGFSMMNWTAAAEFGAYAKDYHLPQALQDFVRDALGTDGPAINFKNLTVTLGARNWPDKSVLVADSDVFALFDLDRKPAIILGADLLRDNSLAIDFAGHRLFIGPTMAQPSEG